MAALFIRLGSPRSARPDTKDITWTASKCEGLDPTDHLEIDS